MSDLQIVYTRNIGFGQHGQDVLSADVFIKVLVSFQERLMQLKNARLSVFMAVATQEPKIILTHAAPLSLRKMEKIVPYSRPSIIDALDYLVEYRFLVELPDRGPEGEKQYRVCQYAWFGTKSGEPAFHPDSEADIPAQPPAHGMAPPETGGQNFLPPPGQRGTTVPFSPQEGSKDFSPGKKISLTGAPLEEVEVTSTEVKGETSSTTEVRALVKEIFSTVGMYGADLEKVSALVTLDQAKRIARWVNWARENAPRYESPPGIAKWQLLRDPRWEPNEPEHRWDREEFDWDYESPDLVTLSEAEQEAPDTQQEILAGDEGNTSGANAQIIEPLPTYSTRLPGDSADANSIWQATLRELELALPKVAFDTWVRPSFALGFTEDGALMVGVHSVHAEEWMKNRLQTTIERTVTGVAGKTISVRYQVGSKRPVRS